MPAPMIKKNAYEIGSMRSNRDTQLLRRQIALRWVFPTLPSPSSFAWFTDQNRTEPPCAASTKRYWKRRLLSTPRRPCDHVQPACGCAKRWPQDIVTLTLLHSEGLGRHPHLHHGTSGLTNLHRGQPYQATRKLAMPSEVVLHRMYVHS